MCGRYSITQDLTELEKIVKFICKITDFKRRYNIAPRSHVPVLVWENGQNVLKEMRWGLIPGWSKDEKIGDKLTNARAETLTEKPSFKKPFQTQRCLIPATGYFEWQRSGTSRIPLGMPSRRWNEASSRRQSKTRYLFIIRWLGSWRRQGSPMTVSDY